MTWHDTADLMRDISARPFIPYNFLRDLEPEALERLDKLLKRHLEIDANASAKNGSSALSRPVDCRICGKECTNGHYRGQHERAHREGRI